MPQAAAYRNVTHAMPHRDEKCSSPSSFLNTFFQKDTLPQSNTAHVITNTLTVFARFTFTAKAPREGNRTPMNKIKYSEERDHETGFSYFGTRYYDHDLSALWLSVDPMADKHPGISPYAYCAWNPVRLEDPDGKEINPIFSKEGKLLGADSKGFSGKAIVMDESIYNYEVAKTKDGVLDHKIAESSQNTVYFKPETDIGNYSNDGAYPVAAGTDLYMRIDGIKTNATKDGCVVKVPSHFAVEVEPDGKQTLLIFHLKVN